MTEKEVEDLMEEIEPGSFVKMMANVEPDFGAEALRTSKKEVLTRELFFERFGFYGLAWMYYGGETRHYWTRINEQLHLKGVGFRNCLQLPEGYTYDVGHYSFWEEDGEVKYTVKER